MKKLYFVLVFLLAIAASAAIGQCIQPTYKAGSWVWGTSGIPQDSLNIAFEFDATPNADSAKDNNCIFALSLGSTKPVTSFDSCGPVFRYFCDGQSTNHLVFNPGTDTIIEGWVASGPVYHADSVVKYHPGITYHMRVLMDIKDNGKYALYATPAGGSEKFVGHFPFRIRTSSPKPCYYLNLYQTECSIDSDSRGTFNFCNFKSSPYIHTCGNVTNTWVYNRVVSQTGTFTATFDAKPMDTNTTTMASAPKNLLIGLWNGANSYGSGAPAYNALDSIPILIRFDSSQIQVWKGGGSWYTSDSVVNYSGWTNYHFRVLVNVPAKTYTVYVTPAGGSEILLAANYPFRATSATRTSAISAYGARILSYATAGADSSKGNIDISNFTTSATYVEPTSETVPTDYALNQNYPNPFNPSTIISYQLPATSNVKLVVFDMLGREVATLVNGVQTAGTQKVEFKAQGFASGMYFYKLTAGNFTQIKKMVLMK